MKTTTTTASNTTSASQHSEPNRKNRSKSVSFSNDVFKVDGNAVTIREEHGVYLPNNDLKINPFVGREIGGESDGRGDDGRAISSDIPNRGEEAQEVECDNLLVRMGLLKCGHRYRVLVPVPDLFRRHSVAEGNGSGDLSLEMQRLRVERGPTGKQTQCSQENCTSARTEATIMHDTFEDGDLRGEIETMDNGAHHVAITLSARQRGPYCGRLTIQLVRVTSDTSSSQSPSSQSNDRASSPNCDVPLKKTTESPENALISIQVEASIMGKGMGTPKLRNGVVYLGKLAGYDSDEETEWQGFG